MKLKEVRDVEGLFEVIKKCHGRVDLVNTDMVLNLKSEITRYFAMSEIFTDGKARNMELVIYNEEDRKRIEEYMMEEKTNESRERKCIWIGERHSGK